MRENRITQNQYIFIVISAMIGIRILSLPSNVCRIANQQGWIAILIGGLYPFFIVITASIIDKKTNHTSFWDISKKIYGRILSHIFIIIFFLYFLTIFSSVIAEFTSVLRQTITSFLSPIYIILPILILIPLISMCGIYMVGRVCEFYFFLILPLIVVPLFFIPKGSIINVQPIFSSFNEIIKATSSSLLAFAGCEISYFIIGNISNKKNTKKAGIVASTTTIGIYTLTTFMTIYYLGWELTSKLKYPILYGAQAIPIPLISNFTAVFLFIWSIAILRVLVTESYMISLLLSKLIKVSYRKASFMFLPFALVYIFLIIPDQIRHEFLWNIVPLFIGFSFIWGLTTVILVSIRFRGVKK